MHTRVALVTGANRGIGLEIARQLAMQGFKVWMGSRDRAKGEAAAAALAAQGLAVAPVRLDVTDPDTIEAALGAIASAHGRLDVLINNSGVLLDPAESSVERLNLNTLRRTLESNLIGAIAVTQAALPLMRKGGAGRIVNLSTGMSQLCGMGAGYPAYRISKTALNAFTVTLARDLDGTSIKVNAMCPGWVQTDMGGAQAPRTVAQGADTAVWLATLPDDGPSGKLFRDRTEIPW